MLVVVSDCTYDSLNNSGDIIFGKGLASLAFLTQVGTLH